MPNPILFFARPENPNRSEFARLAETFEKNQARFLDQPSALNAAVRQGCRILVFSAARPEALEPLAPLTGAAGNPSLGLRLLLLLPRQTEDEGADFLDAVYRLEPWLVLRGEWGRKALPHILQRLFQAPRWRPEDVIGLPET